MKTIEKPVNTAEPARPRVPFKILLAYDALGNGKRGKECCDRLLADFRKRHRTVDAYISILKLGLLYDPVLLKKWHSPALEANLIVLSVQHGSHLPDFVRQWMGEWSKKRRENPAVLVALLNYHEPGFVPISPVQRFLQSFVRDENITLFTLFRKCGENVHERHRDMIRHRTHYLSHTLLEAMKPHTSLSML